VPSKAPVHKALGAGGAVVVIATDKGWYSNTRWRRLRRHMLTMHPLCADPFRDHYNSGRVEASTDVDHMIPRRERPDLEYDPDNLQCLCRRCHSKKTCREIK
jgi:5-methylcytosine-specific restriction protein A